MNVIEFQYLQNKIIFQCKENEKLNELINKFIKKFHISYSKENTLFYIYSGKTFNDSDQKLNINEIANEFDKERGKMTILVEETSMNDLTKSKDVICPKCRENIKLKIENYKIKLFDCKNQHITSNLSLQDFEKSQYIDLSKIICEICKKNNRGDNETKFYKCYECNINLCSECKDKHDNNHNIMNYKEINFVCGKHDNESFSQYCLKCKINICMLCKDEHSGHEIIYFEDILTNKKELKLKLKELKDYIDKFNNDNEKINKIINDTINNFETDSGIKKFFFKIYETINEKIYEVKENFNLYYKIKKDIIDNFDNKNKYYELLYNLKEINNSDDFIKDIIPILSVNCINEKIENILNLYKKMNQITCEEEFNSEQEKLKENIHKLKIENEKLKIDNKKLGKDNKQLTKKKEEIKEDIAKLEKDNKKLEENIEQLQKNNLAFQREKKKLILNKEELEVKIKNNNLKIKKLEKENDELKKKCKDNESNQEELKKEMKTEKTKNNNLQKENKDIKLENDNLKKEIENSKSINEDLEKQLQSKNSQWQKEKNENKNLKEKLDQKSKELIEERKQKYEIEDKLNKKEYNPSLYQTFNNFSQKNIFADRLTGRNRNRLGYGINNERQYNNLSFRIENDKCPKCKNIIEKLEKENKDKTKKINELEKKIKTLEFEKKTLELKKKELKQTEDDNNKKELINYVNEKGVDSESNICYNYNPGNNFLIIELIQEGCIISEEVANVMLEVDRIDFAPNYPYENCPIPIGYNVTISAPHMHALALEYLSDYCSEYSNILDVGSGSGFLTLALSKMTNDTGTVVGIEHIPELYDFGLNNVKKKNSDLIYK